MATAILGGAAEKSFCWPAASLPPTSCPPEMRFLMLNWRDPRNPRAGGAERVSLAFMRGLIEAGHEVAWFSHGFPGAAPVEMLEGIQVVRAGRMGTAQVAARRWVRRQARFDLVIDQHHGLPWFAPWWARTRVLAYIHEVCGPIWNHVLPPPLARAAAAQERWMIRRYARIPFWTVSESTRRQLIELGVRSVAAFSNGCDVEPLSVLPDKPLATPLRLVTVSRLASYKRVDHVIHAAKLLVEGGLPVTLEVLGGGAEAGRLGALVRDLGLGFCVALVGAVSEAEKTSSLRHAHLLLHASVREGWGLNVIEAQGQGTPAVVYPVPGLVESTIHGVTGRLAAQETPAALAGAIRGIAGDAVAYQILREKAWQNSARFRWPQVIPPLREFLVDKAKEMFDTESP
ncbi:MAG: glycosyltransferase family 4 protein [Limisphaerales bacterium]